MDHVQVFANVSCQRDERRARLSRMRIKKRKVIRSRLFVINGFFFLFFWLPPRATSDLSDHFGFLPNGSDVMT